MGNKQQVFLTEEFLIKADRMMEIEFLNKIVQNRIIKTSVIIIWDKIHQPVLAGVAQWTEHQPANQRVTGLCPSQGTCLGCGQGPQWGACKQQPHIAIILPLPSPLSKNK